MTITLCKYYYSGCKVEESAGQQGRRRAEKIGGTMLQWRERMREVQTDHTDSTESGHRNE